MKILQISSAQQFGGAERHVTDLCIELTNLGHDVHLVVRPFSPLPDLVKPNKVTCHQLALRGAIDLVSAYKLANLIEKLKINIVHTHYARDYPLTALAIRICRRRGIKVKFFLTRHHYLPVRANWAYRRLLSVLDCAIAVSNAVKNTLAKSFNWENSNLTNSKNSSQTSQPKLVTIPNWIDIDKFVLTRTKLESRQKFSLPLETKIIGVVNQLTTAKGQHLLLEAIAELKQNHFIVFAGSEHDKEKPYTKYLEQLANKFGLTNQVKFLGHVKELADLYNALDVIVIPSENEAFSIVCLEAMLLKCPVIAANVGGLSELIKPKETGLHFPVGDSKALATQLSLLLTDFTLQEKLKEQAYNFVIENFSIKKVISQIESLYINSNSL